MGAAQELLSAFDANYIEILLNDAFTQALLEVSRGCPRDELIQVYT
jgi:hypothetical protein